MRRLGAVGLAVAAPLYLNFAVTAISQSLTQAILVFCGTLGLAAGSVRRFRGQGAAMVVLAGTLPVFVLQVAAIFIFDEESPIFVVIFGVAPVATALVRVARRKVPQGAPA